MPTTPTRALPYPSADLPADVPLDMQKLAEKTAVELDAVDARHVRAVRRVMSGQNTFTGTTWTDLPVTADATATTLSFVKNRADTRLIINFFGSAETYESSNQRYGFGVRVGNTDYELARMLFNNAGAGTRKAVSGVIEVTGLAAGSYSIKPRVIKLAGGSGGCTFYADDDFIAYSVEETP